MNSNHLVPMANATSKEPLYFGVQKNNSPLHNAYKQVFKWKTEFPLWVIVWHSGWDDQIWNDLSGELAGQAQAAGNPEAGLCYLVVIAEESLEAARQNTGGNRFSLLWRLLGIDPDHPVGWCRVSDFEALGKAARPLLPDSNSLTQVEYEAALHNAGLCRLANEVLGFTRKPKKEDEAKL